MSRDRLREAYLAGYGEGMRQALGEALRLASKGYTGTEMGIILRGRVNAVDQTVAAVDKKMQQVPLREERAGEREADNASDMGTYLVREARAQQIFDLFRRLTQDDARGMCITRIHPVNLIKRHSLRANRYVWLSRTERAPDGGGHGEAPVEFISPTNLSLLANTILEFLDPTQAAVVLLEGLEYLSTQNDFRQVLRFIQTVNERVVLTGSYLLLSVNPQALDPQEYELLAREAAGAL